MFLFVTVFSQADQEPSTTSTQKLPNPIEKSADSNDKVKEEPSTLEQQPTTTTPRRPSEINDESHKDAPSAPEDTRQVID